MLNKRLATIAAMAELRDSTPAGCLLVTHLPVKAELLGRPELAGLPLVITAGTPWQVECYEDAPITAKLHRGQR